MSRGRGRIERGVLEAVRAWPHSAREIAEHEYATRKPSPAQLAAVRRAIAKLARSGAIVSVQEGWPLAKRWRLPEDVRKRERREYARQRRRDKSGADTEAEAEAFRRAMDALAGPPKPHGVVTKIANLLGMLGSDHDGEVLNAARHAERLCKESNLTWPELLMVDSST